MSQSDYGDLIAVNPDGPALGQFLNLFRDALNSGHSGSARPSYAVAGMIWVKDVSPTRRDVLFHDGTEDILVVALNPTTHAVLEVGGGYTQSEVDALLSGIDAFEVGAMVLARSGQSLTGFLECDGSTYDETVYTGLVAAGHVEAAASLSAIDIDLGADGKLILPAQVGSDVYYYWDFDGSGAPSDTENLTTSKGRFASGGNFSGSEPQITLSGTNIVLPEIGTASPVDGGNLADGGSYSGLAALWDAYDGIPAGWPASWYLSSSPFSTSGGWRLGIGSGGTGLTGGITSGGQYSHIAVRVTNPPTSANSYVLPDSADFNLPAGYSYYVKY